MNKFSNTAFLDYPEQLKTDEWKSLRNKILSRDGHKCAFCGRERSGFTKIDDKYYNIGIDHSCPDLSHSEIIPTRLPLQQFKSLIQSQTISICLLASRNPIQISEDGLIGIIDKELFPHITNPKFDKNKIEFNLVRHKSGTLYYLVNPKGADLKKIKATPVAYAQESRLFLNVHHKRYIIQHKAWEYEENDLITLCNECHTKIHQTIGAPVYSNNNGFMEELYLTPCKRCNGTGYFSEYKHIEDGICFRCRGARFEELISPANESVQVQGEDDLPF